MTDSSLSPVSILFILVVKGVNCQIDIDECLGKPCLHGATCRDLVNDYVCTCAAGWRGRNCSENINECEESFPCQNGATCTDQTGGYKCACLTSVDSQGKMFAGRNCSVELTGCYGIGNRCENNATCQPFLKSDGVTQASSCRCLPGYTGDTCSNATTVSMNSYSRIMLNVSRIWRVSSLELSFKTTLDNGVLFFHKPPRDADDDFCLMEIFQSKLIVAYNSKNLTFDRKVNDGEWHTVGLSFIRLSNSSVLRADLYGDGNDTIRQYMYLESVWRLSFWETSTDTVIGTVSDRGRNCSKSQNNFTGCLRDITITVYLFFLFWKLVHVMQLPSTYKHTVNVTEGCPRVMQCTPDPCNGQGLCHDAWTDYYCTCQRPYYGKTCQYGKPRVRPSYVEITPDEDDLSTLKGLTRGETAGIAVSVSVVLIVLTVVVVMVTLKRRGVLSLSGSGAHSNRSSPKQQARESSQLKPDATSEVHVMTSANNTVSAGLKRNGRRNLGMPIEPSFEMLDKIRTMGTSELVDDNQVQDDVYSEINSTVYQSAEDVTYANLPQVPVYERLRNACELQGPQGVYAKLSTDVSVGDTGEYEVVNTSS